MSSVDNYIAYAKCDSNHSKEGCYAVGVAVSDNGLIAGPWRQEPDPVFPENGGHGMVFRNKEGELQFLLHYPNDKYQEHPVALPLIAGETGLKLKD